MNYGIKYILKLIFNIEVNFLNDSNHHIQSARSAIYFNLKKTTLMLQLKHKNLLEK